MKKLFLLAAAGMTCFAAGAQQSRVSVVKTEGAGSPTTVSAQRQPSIFAGNKITQSRFANVAKTAATPFYTESFGSGTATTLPTGWSATAGTGFSLTWRWTNVASPAPFNIGVLNSTTRSNGWMIFDSDSIGNTNPTVTPITGELRSPSINCATHPTVLLSFEEAFRQFQDSCFVDVSNNGTTWTTFPVVINNSIGTNNSLPSNSYTARINISSVAANQANVQLRFRYRGTYAGGSYNWLVDDVSLSELDPVEMGIDYSGMFLSLGGNFTYSNWSLFSNYPRQLLDSLLPVTYLTNYGANSNTNVQINAQVFNGTTSVYNKNVTGVNSPTGAVDSIIDWDVVGRYKPTAVGAYTAAFSVNHPGDALAGNNVDTQRFNITDTVLTTFGPLTSGSANYLHRGVASGVTEASFYSGARFDIPEGITDTVTSVSVSYDSRTTAGVNTVVQLYKVGGASGSLKWDPVTSFRQKTLTAADISTTATRVYTTYYANTTVAPYILTGGTYAAVVSTINAPASSTVLITTAVPINGKTNIAGFFGQSDSSKNDAAFNFGVDPITGTSVGVATGSVNVPLVRINFGNKQRVSVDDVTSISGLTVGAAFPNPANTAFTVPVEAKTSASGTVSLSNMLGQVLEVQNFSVTAGQKQQTVFSTEKLAAGTYFYTVTANGGRVTGRMVVAH